MRALVFAVALALSSAAFAATTSPATPSTTNNDDSCDIAVQPAATLLLPYFEVDFKSPVTTAFTTLFTIQNVSPAPQIANVTLWTDWGYPALSFPIFLTGYDVQGINLYDVFARAAIAPGPSPSSPGGTSVNTSVPTNPTHGTQPFGNAGNPHFLSDVATACSNLPGAIPAFLLTDLQLVFTTGRGTGTGITCISQVGGVHSNAIGYATIDVVATCSPKNPSVSDYFAGIALFDNVLAGDYQHINPNPATGNYAGGEPLVHIRAVPEGGPAGGQMETALPYTFYDRYTTSLPDRRADRRQPLPSTFAPRFIQGGTGGFNTKLTIWREGVTTGSCSGTEAASANSNLQIADVVRFDEHENATLAQICCCILCSPGRPGLPPTVSVSSASQYFPPTSTSGDIAGWLYLNLNNGGSTRYSASQWPGMMRDFRTNTSTTIGVRQSQNWVVTSMYAEGRYAVESTALVLGNGCSPSPPEGAQIAPAPNPTP